jgi:hypothetical protein
MVGCKMKAFQTILFISTKTNSIRSDATGWGIESGLEAYKNIQKHGSQCEVYKLGYVKGYYSYPTVLHALGSGFKLLSPPIEIKTQGCDEPGNEHPEIIEWEWWLVKDEECD